MELSVECALQQIEKLSRRLAKDVAFRKKFEAIIGDTQTSKNKRVLQMRALLKSNGFKSPSRVQIFNVLGLSPKVVLSYNADDKKLQTQTTLSFTFQLQPGP